jgi:hypothetical protein
MSVEYYISSNKYSLQERQTKQGKVYDVMFRIVTLDGEEKLKNRRDTKQKPSQNSLIWSL